MFYKLDIPDYMLTPPEDKPCEGLEVVELTDYERFEMEMEDAGKWVPAFGETIYIPYDDDIDCFSEVWDGNISQQELAERELIFPTAAEAIAKARTDLEGALGHAL